MDIENVISSKQAHCKRCFFLHSLRGLEEHINNEMHICKHNACVLEYFAIREVTLYLQNSEEEIEWFVWVNVTVGQ